MPNTKTPFPFERTLTQDNIKPFIQTYESSIENIEKCLQSHKGKEFLKSIKRNNLDTGPYPNVSLFEAANRIMTDLVIIHGVKWLLDNNTFPFENYTVEYGNEDNNPHDIIAEQKGVKLHGEAFNVSPSFFQAKKTSMLKKLRNSRHTSNFNLIIVNKDAFSLKYAPKLNKNEYILGIDISNGKGKLFTNSD